MDISHSRAYDDYLDYLIRTYPKNDYKRVKRLTKQEKRKRFLNKALEVFFYIIASVIIGASMITIACADSIVDAIIF